MPDRGSLLAGLVMSDPPTLEHRLHLMAARIDQCPIVVVTITRFAKEEAVRESGTRQETV
jgi:hypothetical protein